MVLPLFMCMLYWSSNFEMRRQIERTVIILGNSLNQIFRSSHSDVFWNIGFLADWPNPWKIWAEEFLFHYLLKLNFSIRIYPEHFQIFQEQLFSKNSSDAAGIVLKSILQNQKGFYKTGVLYLWSKVQICRTSIFYKMIGMYTRCRHVRSSVRNAKYFSDRFYIFRESYIANSFQQNFWRES